MLRQTLTSALLLCLTFTAQVQAGTFITAPCTSDSDCTSGCCGFNSGKCAGPVIAQERDGGCGHGDAQPNDRAAQAFRSGMAAQMSAATVGTTLAAVPATNVATAAASQGTFFITHACANDGECASGCCGFRSGLCAGPIIAQTRDGGCGHGNAQPNADAARALGFTGPVGGA